jgi:DNA processing protein
MRSDTSAVAGKEAAASPGRRATLALAVAAARYARSPARLAAQARKSGTAVFAEHLDSLDPTTQARVSQEADELEADGVAAVLLGSEGYPVRLSAVRSAPPVLFYTGSPGLLTQPGIGMCGARTAGEESLRAATACAEVAADAGLTVISGYARGVDVAAHVATLRAGGGTIVVLPEGIRRFRVKRGAFSDAWDPTRVLVVSQFSPSQSWNPGGAMARNTVILGLGLGLVVVAAGENGGTLDAGLRALEANRPVIALEFAEAPIGNSILLRKGAVPVRSRAALTEQLAMLGSDASGNQFSFF